MKIGVREIICSQGPLVMKAFKLFDLLLGTCVGLCVKQRRDSFLGGECLQRILIIRPGGIGDAVFILPFVRALRQKYANAEIDILCERRNRDVFMLQKDLSLSFFCYNNVCSFFSVLKKQYDVIVDTEQWHYLSAIFCYFSAAAFRIGFVTRPTRRKFFDYGIGYSVQSHESENFQNLFKPLLKDDFFPRDALKAFFINDNDALWGEKNIPKKAVVVSLGASIAARYLSVDQVVRMTRICLDRGFDVVLLGSQQNIDMGKNVRRQVANPRVIDLVGKTTLGQAAAIMKSSQIVFASDSGLAHIANAVGAFTVVFFGPGNKAKWQLLGDQSLAFSLHLPCSPCTFFGYTITTCGKKYDCMRNFDVDKILDTVFKKVLCS